MIDKSLKQHYDVPETKKIKGQLHKLAYITAKEANLLQKSGGQKVMTPEGIPAYPPQGRSVQHGGQKSTPRDAPQRDHHPPVHTPAPEPDRQDRARQQAAIEQAAAQTKVAEAIINTPSNEELLKTGILQGPELPITTGEGMIPGPIKGVISQPNIPITRDVIPAFVPRKTTTVTGGIPHREDPFQKIVYQPTDLPKRTYDPRTDPNALLDRGGGILKGLGTAAASVFLPMLLPAKAAAAYKMYNTAKTASAFAKKFGVTDKDVVQTLTNKVLDKDILKQTQKDDIPKVADRHPGTDKKKKTTREPKDGDGVNRILPETLQSTVSEGTQQYLSDEMKEQYLVAQNKMKAALASGYYTDQDGRQIQLSDEQVNALTQWITKIDDLTRETEEQVMGAADGGRVDKALGGRVRDI